MSISATEHTDKLSFATCCFNITITYGEGMFTFKGTIYWTEMYMPVHGKTSHYFFFCPSFLED